MSRPNTPAGQIVILNGAPRSGKSSIVAAVQDLLDGVWINLGVDVARSTTPPRLQPGVGLRPGEADHPASPYVPLLYAALYESVAAHSRLGLNVAVDAGHHDAAILADAAKRLDGLPVLFVGVHCPLEVIMERRRAAEAGRYVTSAEGDLVPPPVLRWQHEVHGDWTYDLELDTSRLDPTDCATAIGNQLRNRPSLPAFAKLRELRGGGA
ncbi:MAG: chloramphenicol phosphotransferase [Actinobacteria bacterium]|nr:chloramphenicol phosphotransferase [Actinomycetota bacterium]